MLYLEQPTKYLIIQDFKSILLRKDTKNKVMSTVNQLPRLWNHQKLNVDPNASICRIFTKKENAISFVELVFFISIVDISSACTSFYWIWDLKNEFLLKCKCIGIILFANLWPVANLRGNLLFRLMKKVTNSLTLYNFCTCQKEWLQGTILFIAKEFQHFGITTPFIRYIGQKRPLHL